MAQLVAFFKRIILIIVTISILISFCATPVSYAKLTIEDGEFYYAGTTKGSYVPSVGIFSWLLNALSELASFLLGMISMGIRMVFVGYTALVEKLLTWALETTAGVNVQGEEVNATGMTQLNDSTNNVTVQAIVYNMVPALNVNFFQNPEKLYFKTVTELDENGNKVSVDHVVSPTGQYLICDKCGKPVLECCGDWDDSRESVKCYGSGGSHGDCGCNGCDSCKMYAKLMLIKDQDPIIVQLKTLIAVWYYLIRLLAVAAMLIILIGIGIKMAISTVASDKAVYKRMLVDWVVGVVIIFTIHYIMIFAVNVNEILVNTVRESAKSINKVQLMQLADTSEDNRETTKTNQDIEIDVYEEIRTRAYDAGMVVGLSGMIMYITMVFMAVKYTLIYIKRFLTLAFLTIIAPALGFAYAIQKALTGRSSSFKSWMTEYLLNLLIQVVHALIYAVFISAALAFSLENVSGIIVALIIMNFSLKAEGIFRKIFNIDPGNKGLLGSTATAGDADKWRKTAQAYKQVALGAKPIAKALTFPGRKAFGAAKNASAFAIGATGAGIGRAISNISSNRTRTSNVSGGGEDSSGETAEGANPSGGTGNSTRTTGNQGTPSGTSSDNTSSGDNGADVSGTLRARSPRRSSKEEDKELLAKGEYELKRDLEVAKADYMSDKDDNGKASAVLEANRRLLRYREISKDKAKDIQTGQVVVGHVKGVFDVNNYFNVKVGSNGKVSYIPKPQALFGGYTYDYKTGRYVRDKSQTAASQFGASKLLGFTDEDKKILKQQVVIPTLKGLAGLPAMFIGMGNLVAHPVMGMGAIAGGAGTTTAMLKKFSRRKRGSYNRAKFFGSNKAVRFMHAKKLPLNKKFHFKSFDSATMKNMRDEVVLSANRQLSSAVVRNVQINHSSLYARLKNNVANAYTLVKSDGLGTTVGNAVKGGFKNTINNAIDHPMRSLASGIAFSAGGVATFAIAGGIGGAVIGGATAVGALKLTTKTASKAKDMATIGLGSNVGLKQDPKNNQYIDINDPYQLETEQAKINPGGNTAWDIVDKHHFKQIEEQKAQFLDDANTLISQQIMNDAKVKVINEQKEVDKKIDNASDDLYNQLIVEYWLARGYKFDIRTGIATRIAKNDVEEKDINKEVKVKEEDSAGNSTVRTVKLDPSETTRLINKELDNIIASKIDGQELDIDDEKMMSEIMSELSGRLAEKGIIGKTQNADILFKQGTGGLKSKIKDKAASANEVVKNEIAQSLKLNNEEFEAVREAVIEVAMETGSKSGQGDGNVDLSQIDQQAVLEKVQQKLFGTSTPDSPTQDTQGKKSSSKKSKGDAKLDAVDNVSKKADEVKLKTAISTLLANGQQGNGSASQPGNGRSSQAPQQVTQPGTQQQGNAQQNMNNLLVNIKDENAREKISNILTAQTGVSPVQIRDRITSREVKGITKDEGKKLLKKSVKAKITDLVAQYAGDEGPTNTNPEANKTMSRAEKIKQAEEATKGLDSVTQDAVLRSLQSIMDMQEKTEELNLYAAETITSKSKFMKRTNKNLSSYLAAKMELSQAKQEELQARLNVLDTQTKIPFGNPNPVGNQGGNPVTNPAGSQGSGQEGNPNGGQASGQAGGSGGGSTKGSTKMSASKQIDDLEARIVEQYKENIKQHNERIKKLKEAERNLAKSGPVQNVTKSTEEILKFFNQQMK